MQAAMEMDAYGDEYGVDDYYDEEEEMDQQQLAYYQ